MDLSVLYTSEAGDPFTRDNIRNLVVEQRVLERLQYGSNVLNQAERMKAIEVVTNYTLRLCDWQHPGTILEEIFHTQDEISAVTNLIEEALCS